MRRLFSQPFLLAILLVGAVFVVPHAAHAEGFVDSAFSLLTGSMDIFYGLLGKVFWWVLIPIAGFVFQLLGLVIDTAIFLSLESSFYNAPAIGLAWSIVRDLCNMVFIFVLIYEGIRTILSIGNSATVKRTITSVIIAAVLLNFSLFFTKVVIDASNIASTWFIQGIQNIGGDGSSVSGSIRAALAMEKLTAKYQTGLNMTSFSLEAFTTGFLLFALTCVGMYVFFNIVFLLIGRIVAFIYLLIMSPLGFVGLFVDIPQIKDYGKEWRDELMAQAMMLPMFFLMVYITLFIVDRADDLIYGTSTAMKTGTVGSQEFTPVNYVFFLVIIAMLMRAKKTAEKYSGEIGGMFAGAIKSATTFVGGAALMGTVGRAATWAKDNKTFQAAAARSGMADLALKGVAGVADSGFGVKSSYNSLSKIAGLDKAGVTKDAFKGADSYSKQRKAEAEAEKKAAERFGKGAEGEANRLRYAERRGNDMYNSTIGKLTGSQANLKKAMEDVQEKAAKELVKSAKEDAKKKANAANNQVVMAETAQKLMSKQALSADPAEVAKAAATSQALVAELKAELEKEGKDDYLKFVRGFDENRAAAEKEAVNRLTKIVDKIGALQDEAQHMRANGAAPEAIASKENEIRTANDERAAANTSVEATKTRFAEMAKKINDEDREEASKKFVALSADQWKEAEKKYVAHTDEVMNVIEAAEKALEEAVKRDTDLADKKAHLAEAQKKITDLIGKPSKYEGDKDNRKRTDEGSGLKKKASELKEESKRKEREYTVSDSKEDKEEDGDKGDKKEGGEKK